MVGLHKDPKGKTIFEKSRTNLSNFIPKNMSGENPNENMETLKNRIAELETKLKIIEVSVREQDSFIPTVNRLIFVFS